MGATATSYTVTSYIAGVTQSTTTVAAPATSANVSGLTNSTAYTFTVHASNSGGSSAESAHSGANTPLANLIYGDDFNGTVIDPSWTVYTRDGDQSNGETQYYLPANVSLDGSSNLVIVTKSQTVTLPGYNDGNPPTYTGPNVTRNWTSGAVQWASYAFTYGKVQISAKVSGGSNLWPAFYTIGAACQVVGPLNPDNVGTCNWPQPGSEEIDIAEWAGAINSFDANYYYNGGTSIGAPGTTITNATTTFHTYEVDWSAGSLNWKVDGASFATWTTSVASQPMFLLLQTAMRGTPTLTQPNLSIDWVRIFHN